MGLLTITQRKEYFQKLKLGEYNKTNIRKFQQKYFKRHVDIDGIYGFDTDKLLRHVYNCSAINNIHNFSPDEFKCDCGGKYCTGYPDYMKLNTLKFMQRIRDYTGKPMIITSGLRCKNQNRIDGGVSNSKHLTGRACDYFISGQTSTLAGRKKLINIIKDWKNHDYSYCWGYNSNGDNIYNPNMGNAIHTQTK